MVYVLDDDWDGDLRVIRAGTAAFGLYARCGMYVARKGLDGFVPSELAASYGTPEWARKLVEVGLWETRDGGYFMPDFLSRNLTAKEAAKRREEKAERQRRWLESKGKRRGSRPSPDASRGASTDTSGDSHHLLPSPTGKEMGERQRYAHGAALAPDDWGEDPLVIAEHEEQMRLQAEAAVTAIVEDQRRRAAGAAQARAAIKRTPRAATPDVPAQQDQCSDLDITEGE